MAHRTKFWAGLALAAALLPAACAEPPPAQRNVVLVTPVSAPPADGAACGDPIAAGVTGPVVRDGLLSITDPGGDTTFDVRACMRFVAERPEDRFVVAEGSAFFLDRSGHMVESVAIASTTLPTETQLAPIAGSPLRDVSRPFHLLSARRNVGHRLDHSQLAQQVLFELRYAPCSALGVCDYGRTTTAWRVVAACVTDSDRPGVSGACRALRAAGWTPPRARR